MTQLSDLIKTFEALWPIATAEDWDRPGLMLGHPSQEVSKVVLSVDVTAEVVAEASESGAQLLLSHHPMLLRGVNELGELTLKGNLAAKAIRSGLAVFAAHTNADIAEIGVGRALAESLGMTEIEPLDKETGHGSVGKISETTLLDFARFIASKLPPTAQGVRVAGAGDKSVSRVALVAGAGDSYLGLALKSGADVFITSDLRHHPSQDFIEQSKLSDGPALIDIAHWAAEWLWLDMAARELALRHPECEFVVSDLRTDPWDFAVMQ